MWIEWNTVCLDEFINLAGLTKAEEQVLRTKIAGYSRVKQAYTLHMSVSKVDRLTRRIRDKYDRCQVYSDILPKRER